MPAFPNLFIPIVDVRDVAAAHILAMTSPAAAGQRFLLSNGPAVAMKEIGATIKADVGEAAERVPTRSLPNFVVRAAGMFSPRFRHIVPDLDYAKRTSNAKARQRAGLDTAGPERRHRRRRRKHGQEEPGQGVN